MSPHPWQHQLQLILFLSLLQVSNACYNNYSGYYYCVSGLWYFWFGIAWLIVFIVIGCSVWLKKRYKNRNVRVVSTNPSMTVTSTNVTVSSTTTSGMPVNHPPVQPPPYGAPSGAPPAYTQPMTDYKPTQSQPHFNYSSPTYPPGYSSYDNPGPYPAMSGQVPVAPGPVLAPPYNPY